MKVKWVYVVAARQNTDLLVMLHSAILTLQYQHSGAAVYLVVDSPTAKLMDQCYPALAAVVSNVVIVESGIDDGPASSRFIKTQLRGVFEGDLVYLDIDTVVLRPLEALVDHRGDVCGAEYDYSKGGIFSPDLLDRFERVGWPAPKNPYLSSGVLFMRDNERVRRAGELWHERWFETREVMGNTDQPSLHRALIESGASIHVVPEDYNQPIRDMPQKLKKPAVLHFTTRAALTKPYVLMNHLMRHLEATGELDVEALERARDRNDPWVSAGPGIKGNLHTGRYLAAAREAFRRITGRGGAG